jgi:hypothetical protein
VQRLRSTYFSQASEAAARYGVSFDRLVVHLWRARNLHRHFSLRNIAHIEDLVHAVACVDGSGLAWADLCERYERALVRRSRGSDAEIDTTIAVRRMLADLRRRTLQATDEHEILPSLRSYLGVQELRVWLAQRAAGAAVWSRATERRRREGLLTAPVVETSMLEAGTSKSA